MKHIDEYRDAKTVAALSKKIAERAMGVDFTFMEVCGTHTMAIARFGIKKLLPKNIRLLSGPGCPVCVTPNGYLDRAIAIGRLSNIAITTFGDMMRVPGSSSSLEKERANGADIRVVYSPLDAMKMAEEEPNKEFVFLSVGFETTTPTIASTLMMASIKGLKNFSLLTANKTVPNALEALLAGDIALDGFILPGHVSAIIGGNAYRNIIEKHGIPCSVAGFEPTDILTTILNLIEQKQQCHPSEPFDFAQGKRWDPMTHHEIPAFAGMTAHAYLNIGYTRAVTNQGNLKAQKIITQVFEPEDAVWRGIGTIPASGLRLNSSFNEFDAEKKFKVVVEPLKEEKGCLCGAILQGKALPPDCPLFGKRCTPEKPVGACMVSTEGTCAAHYKY